MTDPRQLMMQSWRTNAEAWTQAVRNRVIESRRLATDAAILNAVIQLSPASVLDIGCGEGWLCRALAQYQIDTVGIDASPELIEQANAFGGEFYVGTYSALPDFGKRFDVIVCNFSLLEEALNVVIQQFSRLLHQNGTLLIQTVHPSSISDAKTEGWRVENFAGFGSDFPQPMPWYFRQTDSWLALLTENRFMVNGVLEIVHPTTQQSLSLLIQSTLLPNH